MPVAEANLRSVQRIEDWLYRSIEVYRTIGVETVLSTDKYRRLVETARGRGFRTRMAFVFLDSAERQLDRIRIRVEEGGHDVPEDAVRRRRVRSFEQLAWFAVNMDTCDVYDNSAGVPMLVGSTVDGRLRVCGALPSDLSRILTEADALDHG